MLIYNYAKEFIGIDESYLKTFGFSDLAQLRAESADFADFFVKTPGHIHNFKHVHWIDFIDCSEASEELKVIMSIKSKTYTARLSLRTVYLTDNPTSKGYLIDLNQLRALNAVENEKISDELFKKPPPKAATDNTTHFQAQSSNETLVKQDNYDDVVESIENDLVEVNSLDVALDIDLDDDVDFSSIVKQDDNYTDDTYKDEKLDFVSVDLENTSIPTNEPLNNVEDIREVEEVKQVEEITEEEEDDDYDYSYTFDPHVASDELGLPVDLIEEFIEDFIGQAKDFKDDLYKSLGESDIETVKILSHKLKGVAANLRVEDAFGVLTTVNTSEDLDEIRKKLNIFYKIIAKLSGEEIKIPKKIPETVQEEIQEEIPETVQEEVEKTIQKEVTEKTQEKTQEKSSEEISIDEFSLELKQEPASDIDLIINDDDVPEKIELAELADDDFYATDIILDEVDDNIIIDEESDLHIEDDEPKVEVKEDEPEEEEIIVDYPKSIIANSIGLDLETFEELLEDYIHDSRELSINIHKALANDDFEKCKKEAIVLKGISESMHVKSFNKEVEILMNSSDKNEMNKAIKIVDIVINKISNKA